jgi:heme oxygenase
MSGSPLENAATSAMSELREATWPSHQRLDKRIDFNARLATVGSYRRHIERMWGFYVSIEAQLASGVLGNWPPSAARTCSKAQRSAGEP